MILKSDGFGQVYYFDKDFKEPENVTVKCLSKTPRAELTIVNHVMSKYSLGDEELKNVIFNRGRIDILKFLSKMISFNTLYAIIYHVLLVYHLGWVGGLSTVRLLNNKPSQILKSIVIVDDEEDLCNLFTEVLQNNGYNVLGFLDPLQALVHIQANPNQYCLLISDFRMNKLNGCELGIKVQELNNNIKVIIISACENIEGNFRNFELLNKPISIPNLIAKVRSYVKGKQSV